MKILLDEIAIRDVLEEMELEFQIQDEMLLVDYKYIHTDDRFFYFEKDNQNENKNYYVVELDDENAWELDKFLNPIKYKKKVVSDLGISSDKDIYVYMRRTENMEDYNKISFQLIKRNCKLDLQLNFSDIYLMIPGKVNEGKETWDAIPEIKNDLFDFFKQNIDDCIRDEYNFNFLNQIERKCIAEVILQVDDLVDKNTYMQNALIGLVKHKSGFCVMEIMVPNCCIGGNKLLNYYCGNKLHIIYKNIKYTIDEFSQEMNIRRFGKKRSMVFAYSDVTDEEIINALANEELPMGRIGGEFEKKVASQNIAQYDIAQVYVSHETMFEKCKNMYEISEMRLAYHAIEIFFVELILFQDAAMDKIYVELSAQEEQQKNYKGIREATEKYEQISFDMTQAIRFGDYEQFNFPTVRESAKNVAEHFGIKYVFEKYEINKELLETMIGANKRRIQEKQDNLKNQFLLLLSALATVGTLGEILYSVYNDMEIGLQCYFIAILIVVCGYIIYKMSCYILEKIMNRGKKDL